MVKAVVANSMAERARTMARLRSDLPQKILDAEAVGVTAVAIYLQRALDELQRTSIEVADSGQ